MTSGPIFRYLWKLTCSKRSDNGEGRANNNHRPHYLINSRKVGLVFKAFIVSFAAVMGGSSRNAPLHSSLLSPKWGGALRDDPNLASQEQLRNFTFLLASKRF